ncbi:hypothetical protein CHS0354_038631 [Potamilus streckersoni]|uniref:Uncharacterized protein n=1 Tax=Potamilus streckersoni TaxID=2493646 RepID=A0AAE0WBX3_9BIVA|nr:hypothetical protein CHS0354_038631 [Potamilus streckersoni]
MIILIPLLEAPVIRFHEKFGLSENNSDPEWKLSDKASLAWMRSATKLITYATKDLSYVLEMIYYEEIEEVEDGKLVKRSRRPQHIVQSYNQQCCIWNKLKCSHFTEPQRNGFHYWLNKVARVQLVDRAKFIKFDYVFKRMCKKIGLHEHAERRESVLERA